MNIIINLPSIGYAIVRDFYTEFLRFFRYVYFYTRVFYAVGVDLTTELIRWCRAIFRYIERFLPTRFYFRTLTVQLKPHGRLRSFSFEDKVSRFSATVLRMRTEELELTQLILITLGVFLAGLVWFTIMILYLA